MSELQAGERDWLILQLSLIKLHLLNETPEGSTRDELKTEPKRLVRLLWLDGAPEPS